MTTTDEKFTNYKQFIYNTIKDEPATKTTEFKELVAKLRDDLITVRELMSATDAKLAQLLQEFSELGVIMALSENY